MDAVIDVHLQRVDILHLEDAESSLPFLLAEPVINSGVGPFYLFEEQRTSVVVL